MVTARDFAELNLWQRIFAEHWDAFAATWRTQNGRSVPSHWAENVKRMVGCGDIAVGYREYECEDCGTTKKVGFTCKSKLCLRCFKVAVDEWLQTARKVLFEGVVHRQVVLTVPTALRALVLADARFMKAFADAGARAVKELIAEWRPKQRIKVGIMSVLQLHGRGGNSNPHSHLVVSEGGIDKDGQWRTVSYFDSKKLRRKWQYHVLTALKKAVKGTPYEKEWSDRLGRMFHEYPTGFDVHAMPEKGPVERLIVYLCKYVSSPPISIRRIDAYDGQNVTYHYKDHRRGMVWETLPATEFIGRMIKHLPPKGYRMVRYYGIYARPIRERTHAKVAVTLQRRDRNMQQVAAYFARKRGLTPEQYQAELEAKFGDHAPRCPKCGSKRMRLIRVWSARAGMIYEASSIGPPLAAGEPTAAAAMLPLPAPERKPVRPVCVSAQADPTRHPVQVGEEGGEGLARGSRKGRICPAASALAGGGAVKSDAASLRWGTTFFPGAAPRNNARPAVGVHVAKLRTSRLTRPGCRCNFSPVGRRVPSEKTGLFCCLSRDTRATERSEGYP